MGRKLWIAALLVCGLLALAACDSDAPQPNPIPTSSAIPDPTRLATETPLPPATSTQIPTSVSSGCSPTAGQLGLRDAQGPYQRPEPPARSSVGEGHVLRGVVRSSQGCLAIPNAKVIFWLAAPNGCYTPDTEATMFTDSAGAYTFSSNFPGIYGGNPPHIHLHVSAEGHIPIHLSYDTPVGQKEGQFDVVLAPGVLPTPSGPLPTPLPTEPCPPPTSEAQDAIPTASPTTSLPLASPTASPTTSLPLASPTTVAVCAPTREDGEGPFYVPNAPERISVGIGHILRGVVRSSRDCSPIAGAKLEFWLAGPDAVYDDEHRATLYSDASGTYSFESNFPPGYSGRPPHIHIRVTADGHKLLITQYYPQPGDTEGTFDLVLVPQP